MIYLLLSILLSSCLPLLLKAFDPWEVRLTWAVTLNYLVCVILGTLAASRPGALPLFHVHSWTLPAVVQGAFLAANFYLLAYTAQRAGVSVAALSSRLSVAIPVVLAIPLYGDRLSPLNAVGILGALLAIYLSSSGRTSSALLFKGRSPLLPVAVFFSFGLQFALLKYVQHFLLTPDLHHDYLRLSFFCALLVSSVILLLNRHAIAASRRIRSVLGGIVLGSCNYAALFTLTRLLSIEGWQSAVVFPTYSIGVVAVSTLGAVVLFAERPTTRQAAGLCLGIMAVGAINL
jgi:drug/metabolite transporter (DMT)-like permease